MLRQKVTFPPRKNCSKIMALLLSTEARIFKLRGCGDKGLGNPWRETLKWLSFSFSPSSFPPPSPWDDSCREISGNSSPLFCSCSSSGLPCWDCPSESVWVCLSPTQILPAHIWPGPCLGHRWSVLSTVMGGMEPAFLSMGSKAKPLLWLSANVLITEQLAWW